MLTSSIGQLNGKPTLFVEGAPVPAMAYTTYFEEHACYDDFIAANYRIFFVNVSFAALPINSAATGFSPFQTGVFDDKNTPDYTEFEAAVRGILAACPDAYIFPRVHVTMPRWWTNTHENDVVDTPKGGKREMLFSEAFRRDGAAMLTTLIEHVKASDYAPRVAGWQLCGGQTQEWLHHDLFGSLCPAAEPFYRTWVKKTYDEENATLPDAAEFNGDTQGILTSENAQRYAEFCNVEGAKTLLGFARTVKEATDDSQVVGAFYGYSFELGSSLWGSLALREIIDTPYLDFYCSPNAYTFGRRLGIDWADMMPVDSLKRRGKLAFIECDIRTHLTKSVQEARPGAVADGIYLLSENGKPTVWSGPPTAALSREALRKSFAHQITRQSGIWWFDMWGGWYRDDTLMAELARMHEIYALTVRENVPTLPSEVVFFADERALLKTRPSAPISLATKHTRMIMCSTGVPFDAFMVEDAEAILKGYKAAVFPAATPSVAGKRAMALCEEYGIPYLTATPVRTEPSVEEIFDFYKSAGVHTYIDTDDVIYVGGGYLGIHAKTGGEKTVRLPRSCHIKTVLGATRIDTVSNTLTLTLGEFETALFSITPQ